MTEGGIHLIRVRSIPEVYQMLKADDPDSRITASMLRRWVADGTIPCIKVGRKILLNYDSVLAYLSAPSPAETNAEPGTIRPVPVSAK